MRRAGLPSIATPVAVLLALPLVACEQGDADSSTGYVVERSTEDGIETVRTASGSRWGGQARLVEELVIGEEIGEEPYLFGWITAAWATVDHIYVVDGQVAVVRAFDNQGRHLLDIGRNGQGPGEYNTPIELAVTGDGRVLVADVLGARLNIFDAEGTSLDDWPLGLAQSALGLTLGYGGDVYTRIIEMPVDFDMLFSGYEPRFGMQAVGPEGLTGEPFFPPPIEFEPPTIKIEVMGNEMELSDVPFAPSYEWVLAPGGEMIAGVGNEYRFEIHAPDGTTKIVEKHWDPVPVTAGEAEFHAAAAFADVRQMAPDFKMRSADVPAGKPAFESFQADRSGRVWVIREGPGRRDPECIDVTSGAGVNFSISNTGEMDVRAGGGGDSRPDGFDGECWASTYAFDVFEVARGEFLGTVAAPEPTVSSTLFVEGDTVLARVMDEAGTVRLKKYRLVVDQLKDP